MLGSCETGRLVIVIAPTITSRMEITIATIGRLMKNFDMGLLFLRIDLKAWARFYQSIRNHALAGLQAFADHPQRANPVADFNVFDRDFVVIVHDCDLIVAL